jgi:hypothetical protein
LTYLIRTKATRGAESKVKKLEDKLTKERMKKSPVSGGPSGMERTFKAPQSDSERLDEVLAERKKYQEERGV